MFIVFEGPDGSGKSTQLEMTAAWLRANGYDVLTTREPGGTEFGMTLRRYMLNRESKCDPVAELLLMIADRAVHLAEKVVPALEAGQIVLCDRFMESTLVYQGLVKGHGLGRCQTLNELVVAGAFKPWLPKTTCLFFNAPTEVLQERVEARVAAHGTDDKHDLLGRAFRDRVRQAYAEVIKVPAPYARIGLNAEGSLDEIQEVVRGLVEKLIDRNGLERKGELHFGERDRAQGVEAAE